MESHRQKELVSYLTNCSKISLSHFVLKQHSEASNLEKEFREVGTLLVESLGVLNLVNLLREHGEELIGSSTIPKEAELAEGHEKHWRWIWRDPSIKWREKMVLQAMISFRDEKGEVGVTTTQLAVASQISTRSVKRALINLRKNGILQIVRFIGHGHIRVYVIKPTPIYFELLERAQQWREAQIQRLGLQMPTIPAAPAPAQPAWANARDEREAATRRELNAGAGPSSHGTRLKAEVFKKKVGA